MNLPPTILRLALDTPLDALFDYAWDRSEPVPPVGSLVQVSFGRREVVGLVMSVEGHTEVPAAKMKSVMGVRALEPFKESWIALCAFAAEYYQRPVGEVALPALPKQLRSLKEGPLEKALRKLEKESQATQANAASQPSPSPAPPANAEQDAAITAISKSQGYQAFLLFGVTGSGKTEVYLQAAARLLQENAEAQILLLVPEINLTPQLLGHVQSRFPGMPIASLHSGLAEGERLRNWLMAHTGRARIVVGTRLSVLASLPRLAMIIVDEEHDPSYKQQEGLRYSARDLAIWRAHQLRIPVVLGSATPSLESWHHAQSGRYQRLELRQRAVAQASLPAVRIVDLEKDKPQQGLSSLLLQALRRRLEHKEQSLLFLNRRGYAPVLNCESCGWVSACRRCTAFMVLHKPEQRLRCHHCSLEMRIPRACPTCGNVDVQPMGRGTQRVEETLQAIFPQARILRIDADSTRRKGSAQAALESVHQGEVDILVGTQMVAKGHDFQNLSLVGVLNPDTALFSQDYRSAERLFAQLMQVSGRAGRAGARAGGNAPEVLVQTRYPSHPLYQSLTQHDYPGFATTSLEERRQAGLPPFVHQAMLRAEAKTVEAALAFLQEAADAASERASSVVLQDPIPMTMTRVAGVDRAQLLIESASRPALQAFLHEWLPRLRAQKTRCRWSVEVDPVDI